MYPMKSGAHRPIICHSFGQSVQTWPEFGDVSPLVLAPYGPRAEEVQASRLVALQALTQELMGPMRYKYVYCLTRSGAGCVQGTDNVSQRLSEYTGDSPYKYLHVSSLPHTASDAVIARASPPGCLLLIEHVDPL